MNDAQKVVDNPHTRLAAIRNVRINVLLYAVRIVHGSRTQFLCIANVTGLEDGYLYT